jgi:hypothetical protein
MVRSVSGIVHASIRSCRVRGWEQHHAGDLARAPPNLPDGISRDRSVIRESARPGRTLDPGHADTLLAVIITRRVPALNAVVVGDALVHMATGTAYVTAW